MGNQKHEKALRMNDPYLDSVVVSLPVAATIYNRRKLIQHSTGTLKKRSKGDKRRVYNKLHDETKVTVSVCMTKDVSMMPNEVVTHVTGSAASSVDRVFVDCIKWNAARCDILAKMYMCMVALRARFKCVQDVHDTVTCDIETTCYIHMLRSHSSTLI